MFAVTSFTAFITTVFLIAIFHQRVSHFTTGRGEVRKPSGDHRNLDSSSQSTQFSLAGSNKAWRGNFDDNKLVDGDGSAILVEEEETMYEYKGCFDFPREGVPLYALLDSAAMNTKVSTFPYIKWYQMPTFLCSKIFWSLLRFGC